MKNQGTPILSKSKQMLNEFFHNSSDEEEVDTDKSNSEDEHKIGLNRERSYKSIEKQLSPCKSPNFQHEANTVDLEHSIKRHKCSVDSRKNVQNEQGEHACSLNSSIYHNQAGDHSMSILAQFEGTPPQKIKESSALPYSQHQKDEIKEEEEESNSKKKGWPIQSTSNENLKKLSQQTSMYKLAAERMGSTRRDILKKEFLLNQITLLIFGVLLLIKQKVSSNTFEMNLHQVIAVACMIISLAICSLVKIIFEIQQEKQYEKFQNLQYIEEKRNKVNSKNFIIDKAKIGSLQKLKTGIGFWMKKQEDQAIKIKNAQNEMNSIKIFVSLGIIQYILLIEAARIVNDSRSILFVFFIYQQLILIYKLSVANFQKMTSIILLSLILSYTVARSQLFYVLEQMETKSNDDKKSLSIVGLIIELIFAASLFCQSFPLRMHTLSPFIANSQSSLSFSFNKGMKFTDKPLKNSAYEESIFNQYKNDIDAQIQGREKVSFSIAKDNQNNQSYSEQFDKNKQIKKMYQDILNVMPEGVALINSSGKLVYANKTLSKILQCQKSQIKNILFNLATKPKDKDNNDDCQSSYEQKNNTAKGLITQVKSLRTISGTSPKSVSATPEIISPLEKKSKVIFTKPSLFNKSRKAISSEEIFIGPNLGQQVDSSTQMLKKQIPTPLALSKTQPCDADSYSFPIDELIEDMPVSKNSKQQQKNPQTGRSHQQQPYQGQQHCNLQQQQSTTLRNKNSLSMQFQYESHPINSNNGIQFSKKTNEYSEVLSLTNYYPIVSNHQQLQQHTPQTNFIISNPMSLEISNSLHLQSSNENNNFIQRIRASSNSKVENNENFVRKQISKKFKNTEIQKKDTNVSDILSSIFENLKSTKEDFDTKTAKTFKLKKYNTDANRKQSQPSVQRQGSFLSQMKNQQNIGYFQYIDDKIKVEVDYHNTTLVISMVSCEIVANGVVEQLVLVLVDPLWMEMYEKKVQDMNSYRMKMFASLSHELRTPLNCSILMLQQLKNSIKEEQENQMNNSLKEKKNDKLTIRDKIKLRLSKENDVEKVDKKPQNNEKINLKVKEWIDEYIDPALNSSKLLLNLINDILDFVQIDSGKFQFCFIKFNLEDLLANCISMVGIQSKQNNNKVQLSVKYDERCPKIINSDPNRIRQIILNFLSNSLKFTQQGQIILSATLLNCLPRSSRNIPIDSLNKLELYPIDEEIATNPNGVVEIAVEDQGIGISPDEINNIFTIFNKIELGKNQTLNSQGCGLGLTISNSIAKGLGPLNQGGIRVKSEIGRGSIFSILVEDREDGLQEHKFYEKEETIKKMATINSLVETPISKYNKDIYLQASSFHAIDSQHQKIMEESQIHPRLSIHNSNFTNVTSKTVKTNKTLKSGISLKSVKLEDSCCINDSDMSKHLAKHFTPIHGFSFKEDQDGVHINDFVGSSFGEGYLQNRSSHNIGKIKKITSLINCDNVTDQSDQVGSQFKISSNHQIQEGSMIKCAQFQKDQSSQQQSFNNEQDDSSQAMSCTHIQYQSHNNLGHPYCRAPIYKTSSLLTKTMYKTKTYETIKTEMKEGSDAYASYDGIKTSKKIPKITSSVSLSISKGSNHNEHLISPVMHSSQTRGQNKLQKKAYQLTPGFENKSEKEISELINITNSQLHEINMESSINYKDSFSKKQIQDTPKLITNGSTPLIKENLTKSKTQKKKNKKECECPQILVVDDNGFNVHALTMQLKTYKFKIDQASNGQMAVDKVKKRFNENSCCQVYRLIFMDIEMPIKNGYEATEEIRIFFNNIQGKCRQPIIVACTAYVSDEDKKKALAHKMDDFIKKPVFQAGLDLLLEQWYDAIFEASDESFSEEDGEDDFREQIIE